MNDHVLVVFALCSWAIVFFGSICVEDFQRRRDLTQQERAREDEDARAELQVW